MSERIGPCQSCGTYHQPGESFEHCPDKPRRPTDRLAEIERLHAAWVSDTAFDLEADARGAYEERCMNFAPLAVSMIRKLVAALERIKAEACTCPCHKPDDRGYCDQCCGQDDLIGYCDAALSEVRKELGIG